jgi:CheY-like chemotaxis protein
MALRLHPQAEGPSAERREIGVSGRRILLVEDESLVRLVLSELLLDDGFDVLEAQDGDEAIRMLGQIDPPHLLITDITMPGRADGNVVATAAKQRYPGLPVIYSTGRPGSVKNRLDGNDDIVAKPYSREVILSLVRRVVGGP